VAVFDDFYADLAGRLRAARSKAPGKPVILYGHSLGGLIAIGYVLRGATGADGSPAAGRPQPDLLVLSAPGLDSTIPAWKMQLARILGRIVPTLSIPNPLAGELLSRDPAVGQRYHADPLVLHAGTAGFGAASLAEQAWVRSALGALTIPTLVIHGEDDPLVPVAASAALGDVPGVTRRTYPGIRHELHNEPEGPRIVAEVIAWIKAAIAGWGTRTASG
jgi:alpha-beta hydrolase superfamily lysophospholipase